MSIGEHYFKESPSTNNDSINLILVKFIRRQIIHNLLACACVYFFDILSCRFGFYQKGN